MAKPRDNVQRKIGSQGRALVHSQVNPDHWDYREESGNDYGRDCTIELSENDEWLNHKVEGQIKGTSAIKKSVNGDFVSFSMEVRTIEYALGTPTAFALFVADTVANVVYFQCIQDYFIENKHLYKKLDQETITIRIPTSQKLDSNDEKLKELAKETFVDGPGLSLKRYVSVS